MLISLSIVLLALILAAGIGSPSPLQVNHALPLTSDSATNATFAFVSSTFQGDNQVLSVFSGQQGMMIYQDVNITIISAGLQNYSIYVNGNMVREGNLSGKSSYSFQASGSTINMEVFIGNSSFTFQNEEVLHQAIQKMYGPKPPPLTATFLDEVMAALKGVAAIFPAFVFGYFSLKPLIVNRKNRTPVVW